MIDILLPTYNGSSYLSNLIDSLLIQTYKDFRLIIRDDGSKDNTLDIVYKYKRQYPEKIILIEDESGNKGTSGSLNILLKYVTSDYFMFCDQDDIWEPNKIEVSLKEIKKLEQVIPNKPILVCTDALCFDENGKITAHSFFECQKFIDVTNSYHKMLALNIVQGATALMNKKVLDVVGYIPNDLFHDWWIAVIVSYYGKVKYIHKPLLRYRQHSSNVVGANDVGIRYIAKKLLNVKKQMRIYSSMYKKLPFRPNIFKWVYYKTIINIKRI